MKIKSFTFKRLILLLIFIGAQCSVAQNIADGIAYQAIVRNNAGDAIVNQLVKIKTGIYSGSVSGVLQWEETIVTTSDQSGLIKFIIGKGSSTGSGTTSAFGLINWSSNSFYVKISVDVNGGNNYVAIGSAQLLSVPYAFHAAGTDKSAARSLSEFSDVKLAGVATGKLLKWNNSFWVPAIDKNSDTVLFAYNVFHSVKADTTNHSASGFVLQAIIADTATQVNKAANAVTTKNAVHSDTAKYALYSVPTGWTRNGNNLGTSPYALATIDAKDLIFKTNNASFLRLSSAGNMLVGTAPDLYNLSINGNDGMLSSGTFSSGSLSTTGAGTRFMWHPQKAAFRAGGVSANQWDDANIGNYSGAVGYSCIAGISAFAAGSSCIASADYSAAMGRLCQATGAMEAYAFGDSCIATTPRSVAMGRGNIATTSNACISIGSYVTSTALGTGFGTHSTVSGGYSTVLGYYGSSNAKAGSFVYADASSSTVTNATVANQFLVRASGGTNFYSDPANTMGVFLSAGSGSWASVSDKNKKENFEQVNGAEVLQKIKKLKITTWNYLSQDDAIRHMGPTAQDFYKAFHLGDNKESISMIDMDGITLLGIKSLYQQLLDLSALEKADELNQKVNELDNFKELNSRLDALETKLSKQ